MALHMTEKMVKYLYESAMALSTIFHGILIAITAHIEIIDTQFWFEIHSYHLTCTHMALILHSYLNTYRNALSFLHFHLCLRIKSLKKHCLPWYWLTHRAKWSNPCIFQHFWVHSTNSSPYSKLQINDWN